MQTDDLIRSLASTITPVSRSLVERRIALGLAAGALATLAGVSLTLGIRPDLWLAMHHTPFWMKWGYTISLAACAIMASLQLARPGFARNGWLWLLTVPVGLLALASLAELARTPHDQWLALLLGESWRRCAINVLLCSVPIFVGMLWAFRRLAPTRLRLAGAVAGLASGASAATLYCLHCPESTATFVVVWYTLGMALAGALGALVGPRFLRW